MCVSFHEVGMDPTGLPESTGLAGRFAPARSRASGHFGQASRHSATNLRSIDSTLLSRATFPQACDVTQVTL
jgi:hypothetical protein